MKTEKQKKKTHFVYLILMTLLCFICYVFYIQHFDIEFQSKEKLEVEHFLLKNEYDKHLIEYHILISPGRIHKKATSMGFTEQNTLSNIVYLNE